MYLVHDNAETLLKNFIESISLKPQSWRVISIEFQNCETLHSPLFQNLCLKNLNTYFEQTDCRVFWLRPSFILVFFQGRALPIEKCVEGFLRQTEFKGFGRFFEILDLSVHWSSMLELVARIYKAKQQPVEIIKSKPQDKTQTLPQQDGFVIQLSAAAIYQMSAMRASRTKPLLLLVEDDPFTLQLVKLALKNDFDIIAAETARQAISYYQRHLPNIVFQDIQLPDGNGIDLLKHMSKCDSESYVVMLSSHTQKEKILDCMNLGAKGFIGKPFTRQRLLDAAHKFKESFRTELIGGRA